MSDQRTDPRIEQREQREAREPRTEQRSEQRTVVDTDTLLRRVHDIIGNAKSMPLSSSVLLNNKDEVLELLDEAIERLPEELKHARWMLREREEYLDKVRREGDEILEAARVRAERMVQRTEIVREAQHTAQRLVDNAREESRRLRMEAEDYCDQKLAGFEIVLERTMKVVQAGREKLQVTPLPSGNNGSIGLGERGDGSPGTDDADAFFDQDRR